MLISVDSHVGLPFLEGLCSDLQATIKRRQVPQPTPKTPKVPLVKRLLPAAVTRTPSPYSATLAAAVLMAVDGALLSLRDFCTRSTT